MTDKKTLKDKISRRYTTEHSEYVRQSVYKDELLEELKQK